LRTIANRLLFDSIVPTDQPMSKEQVDNGPFGQLGPNAAGVVKRGASAAGRAISAPFGALLTVTIADGYVRVLSARGNRVRAWAESELPTGVVQHGLIVDEQTFIDVLGDVIREVTRNGKLNGQKFAIAITGRNLVQRRLTVYVDNDQDLVDAVISASSDSMSVRTEEMQIEWDAEQLDLIDDDDFDDDVENDEDADESFGDEDDSEESDQFGPSADGQPAPEQLGLENLNVDVNGEPDGDPYDVYALALHKHVIRRNLRTVSEFSTRFAGVQPKILALAAAVNSRTGVVLDIESNTLITAVVSNGLPEVIREVGLGQDMSETDWENLVTTQISRAVAFYDSIFPDEPLGSEVEVFLTGDMSHAERAVDQALERLPYERADMPQTLRATEDFPFEKYAANVGLVIVSGKRFWQRAPVPLLPTPKFDYRPSQYRPRPLPIQAILKVAAVLILGFGIFSSYEAYTVQTSSVHLAERTVEVLALRSEMRSEKLVQTGEARLLLDASKVKTERLIAANEVLEDRDAGFGDTFSVISGVAPSEVRITSIDDDGRVVAVGAASADYPEMLAYIRLLEDVPQFEHVQVLSIGRETTTESGEEPSQQTGEPTLIEREVEASLVITRIEIDNSQPLVGEELAVVTDSN
jgi:hypothetical protein